MFFKISHTEKDYKQYIHGCLPKFLQFMYGHAGAFIGSPHWTQFQHATDSHNWFSPIQWQTDNEGQITFIFLMKASDTDQGISLSV